LFIDKAKVESANRDDRKTGTAKREAAELGDSPFLLRCLVSFALVLGEKFLSNSRLDGTSFTELALTNGS
jgi:hypothetical protein